MRTNVALRWMAFSLLGAALSCGESNAQSRFGSPFNNRLGRYQRTPAVSPNLLLNRGGASYFTLVRPQIQAQQQFQYLNTQLSNVTTQGNQQTTLGADPRLGRTGLRARFYNYSHYYQFRRPGQTQPRQQ